MIFISHLYNSLWNVFTAQPKNIVEHILIKSFVTVKGHQVLIILILGPNIWSCSLSPSNCKLSDNEACWLACWLGRAREGVQGTTGHLASLTLPLLSSLSVLCQCYNPLTSLSLSLSRTPTGAACISFYPPLYHPPSPTTNLHIHLQS